MRLAFQRIKVYVRLASIILLAAAIATVLIVNRRNEVSVWFFWLTDQNVKINVVWLMLCTAAGSLLSWWVFSLSWSLWRDMKDVARREAAAKQEEAIRKREAEVAERERLVDRKVGHSLQSEGEGKGSGGPNA